MTMLSIVQQLPATKTCSRCRLDKSLEAFYKKTKTSLRSECKACFKGIMRPRSAKHYQDNRDYYRKRNRDRADELKKTIREAKTGKICPDCRLPHPYWRMDFDHLDGSKKIIDVSAIARRGWSLEKLKEEMAKCEIVCANCHRDRTFQRNSLRPRHESNVQP